MIFTLKLEAIRILKKAKRPMPVSKIIKEIINRKKLKLRGNTPNASLSSIISRDIKEKGEMSLFVRTNKGFIYNRNKKKI